MGVKREKPKILRVTKEHAAESLRLRLRLGRMRNNLDRKTSDILEILESNPPLVAAKKIMAIDVQYLTTICTSCGEYVVEHTEIGTSDYDSEYSTICDKCVRRIMKLITRTKKDPR